LATTALNIGAVFSALNTHYPERNNFEATPFAKTSLLLDQWIDGKKYRLRSEKFLALYQKALATLLISKITVESLAFKTLVSNVKRRLRNKNSQYFHDAALSQAFALVTITLKTYAGIVPRNSQVLGARAMLRGKLIEMATGEGKTYAATIAAATAALAGIPVHVLTANEYLALRDAQNLAPIYAALGLQCTAIAAEMEREARRFAYQHDIVYCTATEVIFDYLRDRTESVEISPRKNKLQQLLSHVGNTAQENAPVLRGLCFALIDEADSILIDEASTPFILAAANKKAEESSEFGVALKTAQTLTKVQDFSIDHKKNVQLSDHGKARIQTASLTLGGLWARNTRYREELIHLALTALHCFKKDIDYVVKDDEVHIVDSNTGRIAEGRQWSRGLHQLIQAKEGVSQSDGQRTLIQLTYQRFFPRYLMLAGMSGTLQESAHELRRVYGLTIERIEPFKKSQRKDLPASLFFEQSTLEIALIDEVLQRQCTGQPILIGTDSVHASNRISHLLTEKNIKHNLLNASEHTKEALIIAKAGEMHAITVATNMAGRGTDIELSPEAASKGGLLVISCQANGSKRIDRQLSGRSGRRGDPGCVKTLLNVKHGVLAKEVPSFIWVIAENFRTSNGTLPAWLGEFILRKSQWLHELKASRTRASMMRSDEAIEKRLSFSGRKD
jgi:preprotein translocase subunit SecA